MNVTKINARTVKTYTLTVDDGEVRDQPYSRVDARYQVSHVEVVKQDGNIRSVTLAGSVLKKDGTPGKNWASERLYGQGSWPEWLRGAIAGLA